MGPYQTRDPGHLGPVLALPKTAYLEEVSIVPKIRLTHRAIGPLTAGRWLTDYWDEGLPGFGVRAHHSGRKTFIVRYNAEGGKRRMTLGTHPTMSLADARARAREILGAVAGGEDPQVERRVEKNAETFAELAAEYMERHAKRKKRRWREDERIIKVDLLPGWRHKKARGISRRDVGDLLDGIVERGSPIMANRIKALISKVFNFGISREIVDNNPCFGVPMPAKARQRDRVLSEEEILAVWNALNQEEPIMAATFKMRLLTAQRGGRGAIDAVGTNKRRLVDDPWANLEKRYRAPGSDLPADASFAGGNASAQWPIRLGVRQSAPEGQAPHLGPEGSSPHG